MSHDKTSKDPRAVVLTTSNPPEGAAPPPVRVLTAMLLGLELMPVWVDASLTPGVPSFTLDGLGEAAARECKIRVAAALRRIGVDLDAGRIAVSLAPSDVPKAGTGFDLAVAAAVMGALGVLPAKVLEGAMFLGELALDGRVQPIRGVLPTLMGAAKRGITKAIVPRANADEASLVDDIGVRTIGYLPELKGSGGDLPPVGTRGNVTHMADPLHHEDIADVRGLMGARRALEVAAAGGHGLLLIGPPGSGKTLLARRIRGLLPSLTPSEALEVAALYSVAGLFSPFAAPRRQFRAPHHTVSEFALVGGGALTPYPGEVSLAHHGVLFLDEVNEFRRAPLEALGRSLDRGYVELPGRGLHPTFPARPLLVCAMNGCPCGYLGDGTARCRCAPAQVRRHRDRLPAFLRRRLDLQVDLSRPENDPRQSLAGEASVLVRPRVARARALQAARFSDKGVTAPLNADLAESDLARVARLESRGAKPLESATSRLALLPHAQRAAQRVARTIADLAGADAIGPEHLAEALGLVTRGGGPTEHG